MKILVDAFGGDNAPLEIMKGALDAAGGGHEIVLVGQEQTMRAVAAEHGLPIEKATLIDAPDILTMEDDPKSILKEKKNSSMGVGMRLLAEGQGDAFVTAGSTGAMLMGGTFIVKRIHGVARPALAALVPSEKGPFLLIDTGANAECRPEMLVQFAHMGALYVAHVLGIEARVGLVNNGVEEHKGGALQKETYQLLKVSGLPFVGNIEAREIPMGAANVVVADGFTGNVILKLIEGVAEMFNANLKRIFKKNIITMAAAGMVSGGLKEFKEKMSTANYGGAPLLGLAKPV
ncbi:MAG: phosphate acyltransferase PlsX, partial [Oscillospiraceae bacterium]|nr:phosphate acyltransferase PlsX [Oscillospiraceae bacterium]